MQKTGRRGGFRSWFVEPYIQVKLGLVFLILNILFSALIFAVFGYYIWEMYSAISSHFSLLDHQATEALLKFREPALVGAGLILLFVITSILVSVRYTYQIYGPLVSIQRFLDQLIEGEMPERLQLRQSDQLQGLAEKLNLLAERWVSGRRQAPLLPIYRHLDELIAGKKPELLKLRDGDPFVELVTKINVLTDKNNR